MGILQLWHSFVRNVQQEETDHMSSEGLNLHNFQFCEGGFTWASYRNCKFTTSRSRQRRSRVQTNAPGDLNKRSAWAWYLELELQVLPSPRETRQISGMLHLNCIPLGTLFSDGYFCYYFSYVGHKLLHLVPFLSFLLCLLVNYISLLGSKNEFDQSIINELINDQISPLTN